MRPDLQTIEKIESYVNGFMDAAQKQQFESEISSSSELKKAVEFQTFVQQAITRKAIQSKVLQYAPATISSISFWTRFRWPLILSSLVLIASVALAVMNQSNDKKVIDTEQAIGSEEIASKTAGSTTAENTSATVADSVMPSMYMPSPVLSVPSVSAEYGATVPKTISRDLDGLATWIEPHKQVFDLNPENSHTIECENGTLIIVPKNAFADKNGNVIEETVQLEVVEALNMADMIAYNLTTMNDDKVLQSGGMLYIQPKVKGEKVQIQKDTPLHIEVPTQKIVPGMMSWKGEVDKDGNINWVEPQEIKKFLIPVKFNTLDFLPEGFASAVENGLPYKTYTKSSKRLVDSLYYSLFIQKPVQVSETEPAIANWKGGGDMRLVKERKIKSDKSEYTLAADTIKSGVDMSISMISAQGSASKGIISEGCYIDPLSIKSIISQPFENTFIATKEFEERLKVLHTVPNAQSCFDLYANNLTKNLYEVDQMVANKLTGKNRVTFENFAAQGLTNVDNKDINQEAIKAFYTASREKYQKEVSELREAYNALNAKEMQHLQNQLVQLQQNYYGKSWNQRIAMLKIHLGDKKEISIPVASVASMLSYSISWNAPGWVNLDCYYPLLSGGEKIVTIDPRNSLWGVRIFQCINTVKSVVPLNEVDTKYQAHFPKEGNPGSEQLKDTYCVGIQRADSREKQLKYAEQKYNPYNQEVVELSWTPVTDDELYRKLQTLSPANDNLIKSLKKEVAAAAKTAEYQNKKAAVEAKIQAKMDALQKENAFIQMLVDTINPCSPNFKEECIDEVLDIPAVIPVNSPGMFNPSKELIID